MKKLLILFFICSISAYSQSDTTFLNVTKVISVEKTGKIVLTPDSILKIQVICTELQNDSITKQQTLRHAFDLTKNKNSDIKDLFYSPDMRAVYRKAERKKKKELSKKWH